MKKWILILIMGMILLPFYAGAQEQPAAQPIAQDWGTYQADAGGNDNACMINVKIDLAAEKVPMSGFFTNGFDKATKTATPEAKKLLTRLFAVTGVSDMRFSTYKILIAKGDLFVWAELEPEIFAAMDTWLAEVTKGKD